MVAGWLSDNPILGIEDTKKADVKNPVENWDFWHRLCLTKKLPRKGFSQSAETGKNRQLDDLAVSRAVSLLQSGDGETLKLLEIWGNVDHSERRKITVELQARYAGIERESL